MADHKHQISQKSTVDSTDDSAAEKSLQVSKAEFSEDEIDLIARIYKLIGNRWSLIAGRLPGRTAEEIEEFCKSKYENSA